MIFSYFISSRETGDGYFGIRAYISDKLDKINSSNLAVAAQQPAPDFSLPLTDGSEAKLSELLQDKEDHGLSFMIGMKNESIDSLKGDDYEGKQVARYIFIVADNEKGPYPGAQIHLYNDNVDETLTTDDDGMVTYYTENAQELKVELLNLPEGYTSNADEIAVGMESGIKLITIEKK